jgi:hypothetical protein
MPIAPAARRPLHWMLLMISTLALASCSRIDGGPRDGLWRAVLQVPGGELPFGLEFAHEQGGRVAYLVNGPERTRVNEIAVNGDAVTLRMPGFNNRIDATLEGDTLSGTLTMVKPKGKDQQIPFRARHGDAFRFSPDSPADAAPPAPGATPAPDVSGRWAVVFADGGKNTPAIGELSQKGPLVTGTFLTPTGDHRFLAGELRGRQLRLSKFDGGQASPSRTVSRRAATTTHRWAMPTRRRNSSPATASTSASRIWAASTSRCATSSSRARSWWSRSPGAGAPTAMTKRSCSSTCTSASAPRVSRWCR